MVEPSATIAALRAVKSLGMKPPRLSYMENISDWRMTDTDLTLRVERVKGRQVGWAGRDFKVTHRGVTIYTWRWIDEAWVALEPFTHWTPVDELVTSTPARARDTEWEEICYRPGTDKFPLDNADRRAQGYIYK